jgi:ketosteroid isomerase-like protein
MNTIETVQSFIGAINNRDLAAMRDLMMEEHLLVDSTGMTISGRDHVSAAWNAFFAMFSEYEIRVENLLAEGPVVAVFGTASGIVVGKPDMLLKKGMEMPAAWRAIAEGGKILRWQVYADWSGSMREDVSDGATFGEV